MSLPVTTTSPFALRPARFQLCQKPRHGAGRPAIVPYRRGGIQLAHSGVVEASVSTVEVPDATPAKDDVVTKEQQPALDDYEGAAGTESSLPQPNDGAPAADVPAIIFPRLRQLLSGVSAMHGSPSQYRGAVIRKLPDGSQLYTFPPEPAEAALWQTGGFRHADPCMRTAT